ncbi:MAG: LmeA family phospholipid-binding protein [Armatimonadota bacterium]
MKRLLTFLIVLAVALGGLYVWWQIKAVQMVTDGVKTACRNLVTNPDSLEVSVPKPVKITGIGRATVPQVVVTGQNLTLRKGPDIAAAKIVLNDLSVSGPPFHFSGIGDGYYNLTVTDDAATAYLQKRGVKVAGLRIPLETLKVSFAGKGSTVINGEVSVKVPLVGEKRFPLTARGKLLPSNLNGEVNYKVSQIAVQNTKFAPLKQVEGALAVINPVITFADWPFQSDITRITVDHGKATVAGRITGVR